MTLKEIFKSIGDYCAKKADSDAANKKISLEQCEINKMFLDRVVSAKISCLEKLQDEIGFVHFQTINKTTPHMLMIFKSGDGFSMPALPDQEIKIFTKKALNADLEEFKRDNTEEIVNAVNYLKSVNLKIDQIKKVVSE